MRVVDFTRVLAGPVAAQILADEGADVVKVEPPGGDESRAFLPHVGGISTYYLALNRGKRSIVLDLRTDAGREVAARLVSQADVVLENFRNGAEARAGLDAATLCGRHPRLVVVSIRAFGSEGAWADRPGYDMVLQAQGGAMSITGAPGDAPLRCGLPVADLLAGLQAAQAATLGLLHRERTGAGQHVVVNMMQVASAALVYHGARALLTGEVEERRGNAHRGLVPYERYACSDGHLVVACGNDALFAALSEALGLPDVPAWRTNAGRVSRRGDVDAAVAGALVGLTVEEADRLLADAGVPAAAVRDVGEAAHHPAVRTARVRHPELGDIELPGPWLYTADTVLDPRPPPALGAHGDEVLAEVGYAPDEVGRLAALGAFGRHDR